jgi:DNA-binding transcriptional LysR family regulator
VGTIDLNLLGVFIAVADTASFSEAARRLRLPKSTVSRSIARLEESMGVRLLHRTTRRVALSTAGQALHERVAPLLASVEKSLGELPELEESPSGVLRVTASVDFGATVLAEIATRFVARYPSVTLDLRLTNDVVDLVKERIDVALRLSSRRLEDSSLAARRAGELSLQLFAAPGYLARRGTPRSPRELDEHDWVVFRAARPVKLEGPGEGAQVTPRGRLVCDDMFFAREATRHGGGIGLLPSFLAESDVAAGRLARVLPRFAARGGHLWIVFPEARHVARKVAAFRDFLVESLRGRVL